MNLGPFDAAAKLPPAGLMRIAGSAATLDLDGWIDRVIAETEASSGLGGLALETSRFGAEELLFIDRNFPGVGVEVSVSDDGFGALFESQDIDGRIRFNRHDTRGREMAESILKRLKRSGECIERVSSLIGGHMHLTAWPEMRRARQRRRRRLLPR